MLLKLRRCASRINSLSACVARLTDIALPISVMGKHPKISASRDTMPVRGGVVIAVGPVAIVNGDRDDELPEDKGGLEREVLLEASGSISVARSAGVEDVVTPEIALVAIEVTTADCPSGVATVGDSPPR